MADSDRNIIEIIVQGVQQSIRGLSSVSEAQQGLARIQETLAQRQQQTYEQVARAAQQSADIQVQAAERAQAAAKRAVETTTTASGRTRDPATGRFVGQQAAEQVQQRLAATNAPQLANLGGLTERIAQSQAQAAQAVQRTTQTVQQQAAALRATASAAQQYAAAQDVSTRAGQRLAAQALAVATAANRQADALLGAAHGSSQAGTRGITYLSVLSAIHAASFLATNQTFSMIGSFATLSAAFGKLGLAAAVGGAAFGAILGVFGQIASAAQQIQQVTLQAATGIAAVGAAAAAGAVAAGAAAVKTAGDIEQQLASVRAFGGATVDQLVKVRQQAVEFGERFGVAAKDVVQASSLFARAGGSVEEAIDGATEAIVRLQVASQGELSAAQAAIALSAALRQFNLTGADSVRVIDNLIGAAQGSALSFTGVQQAFIQAAPGAAALGITIEDLSAAIALLGDSLVKGTTTGTAFKQFMLDVLNPTDKAQEALAKFGVSLKDGNGNALPFLDALEALNKGLGDNVIGNDAAAKAARGTALAIAFGSRAALAANILTREGTAGLEAYRQKLSEVSSSNITDILLLPLNKQLERLQVVLQNTGDAFGASLLPQARSAVAGVIGVLQGLRAPVEALGQAVAITLANQGFGVLQDKIRELAGGGEAASFFNGLLSVVGNVRNVLTGQIIPAIQSFGQTLLQTFSEISGAGTVASTFDQINAAIQRVGITAAVIIGNLASLTREFILNVGVGGQVRQTMINIATAVATNLVAAFQTAVVVIGAAAATMPLFAQAALLSAKFVVALANTINGLRLAFAKIEAPILRNVHSFLALNDAMQLNVDGALEHIVAMKKVGDGTAALEASIVAENVALNTIVSSAEALIPALAGIGAAHGQAAAQAEAQAQAVGTLNKSIDQIALDLAKAQGFEGDILEEGVLEHFRAQAETIRGEARRIAGGIVTAFVDVEQQLPDPLGNIIEEVERTVRALEKSASGTKPGAAGALSEDELKRAGARIEETGRDVNRRLANLGTDAATRVQQNIERALERLDDIRQTAVDRVDEINRQAQDRITEGRRTSRERREDRQEVDDFKQAQEDKFTEFQRGLDKQETAEQRSLDDRRTLRQQGTDDFVRDLDQQVQDVEKAEQRKLDLVQRGFDLAQRARETAFDRAQSAEATAFQRTQEAQAAARQFTLDLSRAKTPEDRARLQQQRTEALADTQFRRGQEDQLTQFRQKQEEAKRKFSDQQETQAVSFRQGLEDRLTSFRRASEASVIKRRRELEAAELGIRREEEDETTRRRLANEDTVAARRREDTLALQRLQDQIEDKRRGEEETRILGNAFNESQKVIAAAEKQAGEVIDKLFLDLNQQADDVNRQIRNIGDTLVDLQDQVPPELLGAFLAQLEQARARGEALKGTLEGLQEDARLQVSQRAATNQAELELKLAALLPKAGAGVLPQPAGTPAPVLQLQTLQVANVTLPPGFSGAVAGAVRLGIQQAVEQGLLPREVGVDLTPVVNPLEALRRFIGR